MSIVGLKRLKSVGEGKRLCLASISKSLTSPSSEEKWNLSQQLRRSSLSISANIAEGHGRYYFQDNVRFCHMARGSLEETLSHLVFAFEAKYISGTIYQQLESDGEELDKMLNGYISYLKKSKQGVNELGSNSVIRESAVFYSNETLEDSIKIEETNPQSSDL